VKKKNVSATTSSSSFTSVCVFHSVGYFFDVFEQF
jgi:hypothetical protein